MSLLWQVTAFTLAHTITLALAALDIVQIPEKGSGYSETPGAEPGC